MLGNCSNKHNGEQTWRGGVVSGSERMKKRGSGGERTEIALTEGERRGPKLFAEMRGGKQKGNKKGKQTGKTKQSRGI